MGESLSRDATVVVAPDQASSELAGEVVIFSFHSGAYYGLDEVGARVWSLIQEPRSVGEIREALLQEYEVEPDRCEQEVLALLERLATEGLIEVCHASAA